MSVLVLIIEIVLILFSIFMIAVVLLQSGKSAGLSGDIAGGAEQFHGIDHYGKNNDQRQCSW